MNVQFVPVSAVTSAERFLDVPNDKLFHCKLKSTLGDTIFLDVYRSEIEALVKQLNGFLQQ